MLQELIVENYAVVEYARIRFQQGLNILTGETGSGKSIVVDSLGLLLGGRASAEMIRTGESRARVSGFFSLQEDAPIAALLEAAGIEREDGAELLVEREIAAGGKSRAFVSNRPVTTTVLRQLAPALGDIHGQNEQQLLFAAERQRDLLDAYARRLDLRKSVGAAFARWRDAAERLRVLASSEQERLQMLDLWLFQRNEIDSVRPRSGEDAELEAERKVLQNVTRLQENAAAAFELLYEAPESAKAQLRQAAKRVDDLLRIDESLGETANALKQAALLMDEAAYALRDYLGRLESDPKRLEDVESRLEALDRLKRKYGRTLEEVIAFREDVARKADEIENGAGHRVQIEKEVAEAASKYETLAGELSVARANAAEKLSRDVETELKGLAMSGTRFQVAQKRSSWTANGFDEIEFLVAPNRGEDLKPLEKIASGGELSRIALALKSASQNTKENTGWHTLVFDEVDAGVGGAAAAAVGRRLKALSRNNQVICVTHLAQIAGFADHHYAVSKREKKGRVVTEICELDLEQRANEIGRMLSGDRVTPEALKQAQQLMQAGSLG